MNSLIVISKNNLIGDFRCLDTSPHVRDSVWHSFKVHTASS